MKRPVIAVAAAALALVLALSACDPQPADWSGTGSYTTGAVYMSGPYTSMFDPGLSYPHCDYSTYLKDTAGHSFRVGGYNTSDFHGPYHYNLPGGSYHLEVGATRISPSGACKTRYQFNPA